MKYILRIFWWLRCHRWHSNCSLWCVNVLWAKHGAFCVISRGSRAFLCGLPLSTLLSPFSLLLTGLKTCRDWGRQNLFWLLSVHHEREECGLYKAPISQPTMFIKRVIESQALPGSVTSTTWWGHHCQLQSVSMHLNQIISTFWERFWQLPDKEESGDPVSAGTSPRVPSSPTTLSILRSHDTESCLQGIG